MKIEKIKENLNIYKQIECLILMYDNIGNIDGYYKFFNIVSVSMLHMKKIDFNIESLRKDIVQICEEANTIKVKKVNVLASRVIEKLKLMKDFLYKLNIDIINNPRLYALDKRKGEVKIEGEGSLAYFYGKEIANDIYHSIYKAYIKDYDYYYMKNSIKIAKSESCEAVIIGNSYPMTGIIDKMVKYKAVNCALSSQDLYYSYRLLQDIILNNKNIKTCVIGVCEYILYHDLSRGKNQYSYNTIKNVYYPILNECHNSRYKYLTNNQGIDSKIDNIILKSMVNSYEITEYYEQNIYKKLGGYFNAIVQREHISILGGKKISSLSKGVKEQLGFQRAQQHNKLNKFHETYEENTIILRKIINYLNVNNVECHLIKFPTTQYYNNNINNDMKIKFVNTLRTLEGKFNFIDLSNYNLLCEGDYIDFDHINESGAEKITSFLNSVI